MAASRGDGGQAEWDPGPEPGEEFEVVDRSQLPGPGDLPCAARRRAAAEGWSAPILTLARRATGNLSASFGSALRAAEGPDGAEGAARAGRSVGCAAPRSRPRGGPSRAGSRLPDHARAVPSPTCTVFSAPWPRPDAHVGLGGGEVTPACVPTAATLFSCVSFGKMFALGLSV